ncbi:hypothetical protein Tco_1015517 [Tanacetum coccineum]|uniref:Uncharacterized protein n=1 Tax=Tanacetum coccineum TaxID=301880 RepID=A0ABQ5FL51_9ASTR
MKVEESLNVTFDETPPPPKTSPLEDDDLVEEEAIEVSDIPIMCDNKWAIDLANPYNTSHTNTLRFVPIAIRGYSMFKKEIFP